METSRGRVKKWSLVLILGRCVNEADEWDKSHVSCLSWLTLVYFLDEDEDLLVSEAGARVLVDPNDPKLTRLRALWKQQQITSLKLQHFTSQTQ